jgi:chemotaxis protein MotB
MPGVIKKAPPPEQEASAPLWMVTFADLMTLLLTFFIMLVAMSTMQEEKIKVALGSLKGALGVLEGGGKSVKGREELVALHEVHSSIKAIPTDINRAKETLAKYHSDKHIQIGHAKDCVTIVLDDELLFAEGSEEIQPGAYPFLTDLSTVIAETESLVEFRGHTDNVGAADRRLNWEVGAGRATSVLLYIQGKGDIDPERLRVVSFGDTVPLVPNNTAANRSKNRRVEIVMASSSQAMVDAAKTNQWVKER